MTHEIRADGLELSETVSIVMPAYNVAPFVGEAIESVLAQTYPHWELIVVDDGSTDGTAAVIDRFADPRVIVVRRSNGGLTAARNSGLERATGAWVMFLDGDDTLRPGALDALVRAGAGGGGERPVVAYGDYTRTSEAGKPLGRRELLKWTGLRQRPQGDVVEFMLQGFVLMIGTSIVRHDVLKKVGVLRGGLEPMEDWVYYTLFSTYGHYAYADATIMNYRMRETSISMTAGLDIGRYKPALDAVFHHPRIAARFDPARLARLRTDREASIYNFIAAQCVRRGQYSGALSAITRSAGRSRRKVLKGTTMMALAALGM